MDNLHSKIKRLARKEKIEEFIKLLFYGSYALLPPMLVYFFVKWDPIVHGDDGEVTSLAMLLLMVAWWGVIFLIHKYRERSKERSWQLAQFLSTKWTIEEREAQRVKLTSNWLYMHGLKEEYPELFEDELLKLP